MAKTKHYFIDEKENAIHADVVKLTKKELEEVQRFKALGYKLVNEQFTYSKVERLNDAWIKDYLKNNQAALDEYEAEKNSIIVDDNGIVQTTKAGKAKKKGFSNGLVWFAKSQKPDRELTEKEKEAIKEAFTKYSVAEADSNKEKMTEAEYSNYHYWTKIFTR